MAFKSKVQYKIDPKTGKIIDTKWGNGEWESEKGFDWGLLKVVIIALIVCLIISGIASLF